MKHAELTFPFACVYFLEIYNLCVWRQNMNERDMRVIKTKESIKKALFELLAVKPLDKVTVVELAPAAHGASSASSA